MVGISKTRAFKFQLPDYKRLYYFKKFNKIPYKDHFVYQPNTRLALSFSRVVFFIYGGRFWFKFRVSKWNKGLSLRFFIWPKQVAIFKKKQYLKKL